MSVSIQMNETSAGGRRNPAPVIRAALAFNVWRSGRKVKEDGSGDYQERDLANPEWRQPSTRVVVERITRGANSTPDTCDLLLPSADDDGSMLQPIATSETTGLTPDGAVGGKILVPTGWNPMDQVKVAVRHRTEAGEEYDHPVFLGVVVTYEEDLSTGAVRIHCEDYRWLLARIPIWGVGYWNEHDGEDDASAPITQGNWHPAVLPVFNRRGGKDRYSESDIYFCTADSASRAWWTRGDVWNYLRAWYNTRVPTYQTDPDDPDSARENYVQPTTGWIDWPEAAFGEGVGWHLYSITEDYDNVPMDLALGGRSLAEALDALVCWRGAYGWGLDISTGMCATLVLYGTGSDTVLPDQRKLNFRRGDAGDTLSEARPEVYSGALGYSIAGARTTVFGLGAPKRYDLTLATYMVGGDDPTLSIGWLGADATSWLALTDYDQRRAYYPSVFCRFVASSGLDWKAAFGWESQRIWERSGGTTLNSTDTSTAQASSIDKRIRAQLFRSTDSGSNWTEVPPIYHWSLLRDSLGIQFSEAARKDMYTWDGDPDNPASYDFRLTISVEADARLNHKEQRTPAGWGFSPSALIADDDYIYAARRECYLNVSGVPLLDGGSMTLKGSGADDEIRNDTDRLSAQVEGHWDQLARARSTGRIDLSALRIDIQPGDYVEKVIGGGSTGERSDWPVETAVRAVAFDVQGQTTSVFLEVG